MERANERESVTRAREGTQPRQPGVADSPARALKPVRAIHASQVMLVRCCHSGSKPRAAHRVLSRTRWQFAC